MSDTETILLDDARASLVARIERGISSDPLEAAFAAWLLHVLFPAMDWTQAVDDALAQPRTPRAVAALGFAASRFRQVSLDQLRSDVEQLIGRAPVVAGTPMPFCIDALALAGVVVAVNSIGDDELRKSTQAWLDECGAVTVEGRGLGPWQEPLLKTLAHQSGLRWRGLTGVALESPIVRLALRSIGIGEAKDVDAEQVDEAAALDILRGGVPADLDSADAVLRLASLEWVRRARPVGDLRRVGVPEVCTVLSALPRALQHWTWESTPRTSRSTARQWDVDHEYHVQNLLWFFLAPLFPDLVDEDYTVKIGSKQPRADLGIPSLRLIVEAKFWRSSHAAKSMIEEIAEDASLYLVAGARYDAIVAVIWDEGRRTEDHASLRAALQQIGGVRDAIIIARPSRMA